MADMQSVQERDEFVKGMYGYKTHGQHSFLIGVLAGYFGTKALTKSKKSRNENNR
jgi:hypothetical protein